jgi:hypothetical protein
VSCFFLWYAGLSNAELWPILIVGMMGAGIGTLGFIGIALQKAVECAKPVGENVSGVLVEGLLSCMAALIPLMDPNNFYVVGGVTTLCTIMLLLFLSSDGRTSDYRPASDHSDIRERSQELPVQEGDEDE